MLDFFQYNNATGMVEINEVGILLTPEFAALLDTKRNTTNLDPTGKYKERAMREFKYIYLMLSWKSPYADFLEQDRHKAAMAASRLTKEEFDDPIFRDACKAYQKIKESDRTWKLLQSVYKIIDRLTLYFDNIVDFTATKEDGSPVYKAKDVIAEARTVGPLLDEIIEAEKRYKKSLEKQNKIKGDQTPGFFD